MARVSVLLAVAASLAQGSQASILGSLLGTSPTSNTAVSNTLGTAQNLASFANTVGANSGIASDIANAKANPPKVVSDIETAGAVLGAAAADPTTLLNGDNLGKAYSTLAGKENELGNGLSWDFSTKGMADTLMGMYVNGLTGGDTTTVSSPLSVLGSVSSGDQSALASAFTDLFMNLDLTCAWQFAISGTSAYGINYNFRDSQEVLHVQYIPTTESQIVSIEGTFPTARYMSYSTFLINNGKLYQIDTLNDISMISKTGVNPFTTGPTGSKAGTYELFVTPKGDQGKANELKYLDEDHPDASGVLIVYRLVMDDTFTVGDGWGSVDPPAMRVKALGFTKIGLWANMKQCDSTNNQKIQNFMDAQLNFKEGVSDVTINCTVFNMENNFVSYDRAQYIPMPDDQHLFSCGNRQYVYSSSAGSDLIIVVGGKLPPSADVRYSSINMVDMFPPGRTVKTVTDSDLRKFYKSGSDSPTYMIAFYPNLAAANRCRMKFPVTPYQVLYGYAISTYPAIVYREIYGKGNNQHILTNLHDQCLITGDCGNPRFWEQQMGPDYPMIAYIECKKDGTFDAAPADNPDFPPPNVPTPPPTPIWEKLQMDGKLTFCVPKISVDVVAWEYFDIWADNTYIGGQASANNYVSGLGLEKGWSPYDVNVDPATGQITMSQAEGTFMPSTVTLAVKLVVNKPSVFFVGYDMCGYKSNTGLGWKCTSQAPVGNWTLSDYDDSSWLPARVMDRGDACSRYPDSSACNTVSNGAHGLWVETCPSKAAPSSGWVYCRNSIPQKCDRSCSSSRTVAEVTCPDKTNAVGFIRSMSPALYSIYVNGKKVSSDFTGNKQTITKPFDIDPAAPTLVLAFNGIDSSSRNTRAALIAEINACGSTFVTDPFWKCTSLEQDTDAWTKPTFNDAGWATAKVRFGANGAPPLGNTPGIDPTAYYIWGQNVTQLNGVSNTYCRAVVPNPLFTAPANFVTFQKNAY